MSNKISKDWVTLICFFSSNFSALKKPGRSSMARLQHREKNCGDLFIGGIRAPCFARVLRNRTVVRSRYISILIYRERSNWSTTTGGTHLRVSSCAAGSSRSLLQSNGVVSFACSAICTRCRDPMYDETISLVSRYPSEMTSCGSKSAHFREIRAPIAFFLLYWLLIDATPNEIGVFLEAL